MAITKVKKYQAIVSLICMIVLVSIMGISVGNAQQQTNTTDEATINTTVKETNTIEKSNKAKVVETTMVKGSIETEMVTTKDVVESTIDKTTTKAITTKQKKTHKKKTTNGEYNGGVVYDLPDYCSGSFKSYTNYQLLSKSSPQWTQVQCHEDAWTDSNGLRKVGDCYCVAMGSYYTKTLGDVFEIQTTGGKFKVIITDWKADCHTDSKHQYTIANGCIVEFYVDMNNFNSKARQMGDVSYADSKFSGKITKITKLGNYFSK